MCEIGMEHGCDGGSTSGGWGKGAVSSLPRQKASA